MNASFIWKGGRWLRSNHVWVWATEIITVRLFTIGTAFFYLVPYNHLSVMCGEKKNVQLSGTSVWKTDSSSFIRKYIVKVLRNREDGSSNTKDIERCFWTPALFIHHENHVLTWKWSMTDSKSESCGWCVVTPPSPLKMGPSVQPLSLVL